jgi:uncharacterized protein (TIGR00251 family)
MRAAQVASEGAPWLHRRDDGSLELEVLVQPRASRDEVVGVHDGRLKVRLAAPPVDGEANAALLGFVARALGLPRAQVTLVRGQTARRKTVRVTGADEAAVRALPEGRR